MNADMTTRFTTHSPVFVLFTLTAIGCLPSSQGGDVSEQERDMNQAMSVDMGSIDMPGVPKAAPGLIARDGEVYSEPVGQDVASVWVDGAHELVVKRESLEEPLVDAVTLDSQGSSWLVVTQGGDLEVFDATTHMLTESVIAPYIAEQRVKRIARIHVEGDANTLVFFILTDLGLHLWYDGALSRLDPVLEPTDMVAEGAKLWVTTPTQVMTFEHDGTALRRRLIFDDQGGDQILAARELMVLRQGRSLFTRAAGQTQWFEVVDVEAAEIAGHPGAPDVWWRSPSGEVGHLYGDYMGSAQGVMWSERVEVDVLGRLLTWDEAGALRRHDRVHRVVIPEAPETSVMLPHAVGVYVSFPGRLERLVASVGGQRAEIVMPSSASSTADVMIPAAVGAGRHTLEVSAYFDMITPPATASAPVVTELGEVTWSEHIEPIFKQSCASCHGVQNVYQLDSAQSWQTAAVPEGSTQSSFEYILSWLESGNMPPGDLPKLTPAQVELIIEWRDQGFAE